MLHTSQSADLCREEISLHLQSDSATSVSLSHANKLLLQPLKLHIPQRGYPSALLCNKLLHAKALAFPHSKPTVEICFMNES